MTWDLKEKVNGDRDKQIKEAKARLSEIDDKSRENNKSLRQILINTREGVELKGFHEGSKESNEWSREKAFIIIGGL